jgi:tetratricopeptide (TPR) repeat protein
LEVDPFHPQAHNNLGTLLAGQGKLAEAATHYQQTIANDPDHRMARFNLGRVLVALGRPREAAEQFEWLLVPETIETPRFAYALATAWLAAGEIAQARKYGEQALEIARRLGQTELAAKIEADLNRMKQP